MILGPLSAAAIACSIWSLYQPQVAGRVCPDAPLLTDGREVLTVGDWRDWTESGTVVGPKRARPVETEESLREFVTTHALAAAAVERGAHLDREVALRIRHRRAALLGRVLRDDAAARMEVEPEQLEWSLAHWPNEAFERPGLSRLRNLYLRLPEGPAASREAVRERMRALRQRIVAGEDFGAVARRESDSSSRYREGRLGWVAEGTLRPELERARESLKVGEVSEIIETGDGLTLLRCEGRKPPWTASPEARREIVRQEIVRRRTKAWWIDRHSIVARQTTLLPLLCREDEGLDGRATLAVHFDESLSIHDFESLGGGNPCAVSDASLSDFVVETFTVLAAAREAASRGLDRLPYVESRLDRARKEILAEVERRHRWISIESESEAAGVQAVHGSTATTLRAPDQVDLGLIRRPFGDHPLAEASALAELAEEVHRGQSTFREIAQRLSESPSPPPDGRIGWLGMDEVAALGRPVWEAVRLLEPGRTSGVLESTDAFVLVTVYARRKGAPLDPERARSALRAQLERRARRKAIATLERDIRSKWRFAPPVAWKGPQDRVSSRTAVPQKKKTGDPVFRAPRKGNGGTPRMKRVVGEEPPI